MSTGKYLGISSSSCFVLIIVLIGACINYLYGRFFEIFEIDYLWENRFCIVNDDKTKISIDNETGSLIGSSVNDSTVYSIEYCALQPLFLTDPEFRDSALTLYGGIGPIFSSLNKFYNDTYKVPDKGLITKDPVLATMILNPWYTSDDAYFTTVEVEFTLDLNVFKIGARKFVGFNADGLYLSWADTNMDFNETSLQECKYTEKKLCEDNLAECECKYQSVRQHYLYMDNNLIITLPMQLYLGKEQAKTAQKIEVKVGGKKKELTLEPIQIKTLADLDQVLQKRFFEFKRVIGRDCNNISASQQKAYDAKCKFFNSTSVASQESLSGLIVVLRRILVLHLPETVINEYVTRVEDRISKNKQLNYLEFFLWLACLSFRDKITYKFVPKFPNGASCKTDEQCHSRSCKGSFVSGQGMVKKCVL